MTARQVLALIRKQWPDSKVWAEARKGGFCSRNGVTRCGCLRKGCQQPGARLYMVGTESWCRCIRGVGHSWKEAMADAGVKP